MAAESRSENPLRSQAYPGLQPQRSFGRANEGIEKIVLHRLCLLRNLQHLVVESTGFADQGKIPSRYTADGAGISPPLRWRGDAPAAGYGLLVEDVDALVAHPVVHAMVVNLNTVTHALAEGALNSPTHDGSQVDPDLHARFKQAWLPPHPPPQDREHRYAFQIFALRFQPSFVKPPGREEFIETVLEFATGGGCTVGKYERARPVRNAT